MTNPTRETLLVDVFATLADTRVDDYDIIDLLQTLVDITVDLFDVTAAGILLADQGGHLDIVASTSEASRLVEVMQIDAEAGPSMESFSTGVVVSVPDIMERQNRWARFSATALEQGFESVHAIPLRLRDVTIGTLNLLRDTPGTLNPEDVRAAQALADVATIGIIHERTLRESEIVRAQLQQALTTRVIIEQAKGVLANEHGISPEDAFTRLCKQARTSNTRLSVLAARVVDTTLRTDTTL